MKMGNCLQKLNLEPEYRTGSSDPISEFYIPCLNESSIYKRAVGYFRSSVYLIVGQEILDFASRGGKIYLICSPELDAKDLDVISQNKLLARQIAEGKVVDEIEALIRNNATLAPTKVLATLLATKSLEIRIAFRSDALGIYHEKIGIFLDDDKNRVSFIGSANESFSGWHANGNFESVEVFCSWHHSNESHRSQRHESNFDNLWLGLNKDVQTLSFPEAASHCLSKVALDSIDDARTLIKVLPYDSCLKPKKEDEKKRSLLMHQRLAIENWIKQSSRGIFEHATGSGKTFTALEAARKHVNGFNPLLILVPSELLLKQWIKESKQEYPEALVIAAGGGNVGWKKPSKLKRLMNPNSKQKLIIIATMQTASTELFRQSIYQGQHLMLIADEVHQLGSLQNSKCMSMDVGDRIGLSATPRRYGDPIGTEKIFNFFGAVVKPIVTLADAVKAGRLVEYNYYPHPLHLTAEESEKWKKLSKQISLEIAKSKNDNAPSNLSERAKILIIQRSRIAKKASAKIPLAIKILKEYYKEGQSWLVYCEDSDQLAEMMAQIKAHLVDIRPVEYHTGMDGDRKATLEWFTKFGGVLVSIKCLDEGVDIPAITHALILASSQNPRQFIQRRGRVLRKAENKYLADIHDVIVLPTDVNDEPEQLSLLKSELIRALEFSRSAINKSAEAKLREVAINIGFDPDEIINDGVEEEES
jgi:superfamily II DNA or RNA helicase